MQKNTLSKNIPVDNLMKSSNSFINYKKLEPPQISSNDNKFYNTSTNFRTNLYKNKFKNISIISNNNNSNNFNLTSQSFYKRKIEQMTQEQIKNYVIYLKNNINSSFIANNELNNEYNKLLIKLRQLNESISKNQQIYNSIKKSIKINSEKKKQNKNIYINLIEQYKLNNDQGENEYNILNQKINTQEKEIIKLINENNVLNDDINQKKLLIERLKKIIELIKYYQININLNNEKNKIILKNENMKKEKMKKIRNEELKLNKGNLKYELPKKENKYSDIINNDNTLNNKTKLKNNNTRNKNINYNNLNKSNDLDRIHNDLNNDFGKIEKYNTISNPASDKFDIENSYHNIKKLNEKQNKKYFENGNNLESKQIESNKIKNKLKQSTNTNKDKKNLNPKDKIIADYIGQGNNMVLENKNQKLESDKKEKELEIYKNSLIQKIKISKKQNEEESNELSLKNKKPNSKILNIKALKRQNNYDNNSNLKNYLTESSLNKDNGDKNNEILSINLTYDNIHIKNKSITNKSSYSRKGKYIYTIDNNDKLLSYGIMLKKFVYINLSLIKGWENFYLNYYKKNSDGSLLLNTLGGLFILTGDNYNKLFYYSQNKNEIDMIQTFKTNHKYGGMLLTPDGNKIIILGGESTNEVIIYNIQKDEIMNLPNLIHKRINSSYNLINDSYIFTFFGKGNNTIEYLDLNNTKNGWNVLNYKCNNFFKELEGHIGFNINNTVVIIVGGKDNNNILIFYLKEKILDVTDIKINSNEQYEMKEFFFDKEKCFNILYNSESNYNEIIGMDNKGNVHCFNEDYAYTILVS